MSLLVLEGRFRERRWLYCITRALDFLAAIVSSLRMEVRLSGAPNPLHYPVMQFGRKFQLRELFLGLRL